MIIFAGVIVVLFILARRGIIDIKPQERMTEIRRRVTQRVRGTGENGPQTPSTSRSHASYRVSVPFNLKCMCWLTTNS